MEYGNAHNSFGLLVLILAGCEVETNEHMIKFEVLIRITLCRFTIMKILKDVDSIEIFLLSENFTRQFIL